MRLNARLPSHEALVTGALGSVLRRLPAETVGKIIERSCVMLQKSLERCAELARQDRQDLNDRVVRLEAENEQLRTQLFMLKFGKSERAA